MSLKCKWEAQPLSEIIELIIDHRGKTPKKLGSDWSASGIRALSAKNIKTAKIVQEDTIRYVDEGLYRKWMKEEVQRGDIFITSEAPFGEIFLWDSDEKVVLSQRLYGIRLNRKKCNPQFVYFFMMDSKFQGELHGRATGTTVIGLRQPELLKCRVALPPLPEQKAIAETLSCLDDKIELNNRMNKCLEEMAQAIFKSWFVDFEPFQDGEFVDSELGRIPKGWRVGRLADLVEIKYGKDHKKLKDGAVPVYGSGGYMRSAEKAIYSGESVLIPRKGTLNNVMYVDEDFWTVDTMFYTIMKQPKTAKYFHQLMQTKDLSSMNAGSAVPSMTTEILNNMLVIIPHIDTLLQYDEIVSMLYIRVARNKSENTVLAKIRDSLLPKLMSGEIRVPMEVN